MKLYTLDVSPWSHRARWALRYHGLTWDERAHLPLLGEPLLRFRLRGSGSAPSAPALVDGDVRISDSRLIAEYADRIGAGQPLFPAEHAAEIDSWHSLSEQVLSSARVLYSAALLDAPEAMLLSLPMPAPGPLRPLGLATAHTAVKFLGAKYNYSPGDTGRARSLVRLGAQTLRSRIADRSATPLVGDRLTWADLAMCASTYAIGAPDPSLVAMPEFSRTLWGNDELREEFGDVLAWRDRVLTELA